MTMVNTILHHHLENIIYVLFFFQGILSKETNSEFAPENGWEWKTMGIFLLSRGTSLGAIR